LNFVLRSDNVHCLSPLQNQLLLVRLTAYAKATASLAEALRAKAEGRAYG